MTKITCPHPLLRAVSAGAGYNGGDLKSEVTNQPKTGSGRLRILDQLRGLCLVIIMIDHPGLFPSLLEIFSGRTYLWISAAEGFFFISGLMIGLVRGRTAIKHGLRVATSKLLERAGRLYVVTVLLTLLYTLLAYWLHMHGKPGIKVDLRYFTTPFDLAWHAATQLYSYGWSDFLPYYVIYLLLSPLVLWLMLRGRWRWVLGLSLAAWVAPLIFPGLPFPSGLRWQAYFFFGAAAGFHYDRIRAWWHDKSAVKQKRFTAWVWSITAGGLLVSSAISLWPVWFDGSHNAVLDTLRGIDGNAVYRYAFSENRTGVLRLPFFLVAFSAAYLLFRRFQPFIMRRLNWLLEPLGANSLYVYIVQGAFAFGIPLLAIPMNIISNTLLQLGMIGGVWWLVKRKVLFGVIPR